MLTVLNLTIILLLLGMAAIWATYGFFSAFLNLVIIIAAGVVAFAVWEPLAYWLLGRMPAYAHGVGLLAPFTLMLIVFRGLFDRFIRSNVKVPGLANQIGGGFCGFFGGVLAFGILLIGANFLPVPQRSFGWEPYKIQANEVVENPGGDIWGFVSVNRWAGSFFSMLSNGSMSPMGGSPTLAEARPDVAVRAMRTRTPYDTYQFRYAHPETVQVVGLYEIEATGDGIAEVANRATIMNMLNDSYSFPEDLPLETEDGQLLTRRDRVLLDFYRRYQGGGGHGIIDNLVNRDRIEKAAETEELQYNNPLGVQNFEEFVIAAEEYYTDTLTDQLDGAMDPTGRLLIVDTFWNNERPGTYNTDNTLRVAIPQVRLQVRTRSGLEEIAPIGYSIEYSTNTQARFFTELLTQQVYSAETQYTDFNMGWVFPIGPEDEPVRFFVRELRYDLEDVPIVVAEEDSPANLETVARVVGVPPLPVPPPDRSNLMTDGVQIDDTACYADSIPQLPLGFMASASSLQINENTEPWQLRSGASQGLVRGRGNRDSTVREIQTAQNEGLIRVKVDNQVSEALLGRLADRVNNTSRISLTDAAGNTYPSIGYAYLNDRSRLEVDIRAGFGRNPSVGDLPDVRENELLFIYFSAPRGTRIEWFNIGDESKEFANALVVGSGDD